MPNPSAPKAPMKKKKEKKKRNLKIPLHSLKSNSSLAIVAKHETLNMNRSDGIGRVDF